MNYRYWKERSQAEMTDEGVQARQNFYEGTLAYRNSDFDTAAKKFKEGLTIWDALTKNYTAYRNDDLNRKDTGIVLRRYLRVLGQQTPRPSNAVPDDLPFKELLEGPRTGRLARPVRRLRDARRRGHRGPDAGPGQHRRPPPRPAGNSREAARADDNRD